MFRKSLFATKGREWIALEEKFPAERVLRIVDEERKAGKTLLRRIAEFLDPKSRARLEAIVAGSERSAFFLAEAVRHAYVHGDLTARTKGSSSESLRILVDALSEYLLMIMDETAGSTAAVKLERRRKRANQPSQPMPLTRHG